MDKLPETSILSDGKELTPGGREYANFLGGIIISISAEVSIS